MTKLYQSEPLCIPTKFRSGESLNKLSKTFLTSYYLKFGFYILYFFKIDIRQFIQFSEEYTLVKICWATLGTHFDVILSAIDPAILA